MSDYAPGTRLEPVMVNVTFDADLAVAELGIGYHIVTPSGRRHPGGFTWHRPSSGHQAPDEIVAQLQAVMDALLRRAADHEGIALRVVNPIADEGQILGRGGDS